MEIEQGDATSAGIDELPVPATGVLTLGGAGMYGLECVFIALEKTPLVTLSSFGLGDVFDASVSELDGNFFGNPKQYVGKCHYTLKGAEFEGGAMVLTIRHEKEGEPIGRFEGFSEGFGAESISHKGHLHVTKTKEHENKVDIKGGSGIRVMEFQLENECIADGQPYDGVDASYSQATNQLRVVVKCGRREKYGQSAAAFFNQGIGNDPNHLVGESPDTRTVRYLPSKLNFAIEGTLSIDGVDYDVYLAQYGAGAHNPWFFGSTSLQGVPDKMRDGILGGAYTVRASGYSSFTISRR